MRAFGERLDKLFTSSDSKISGFTRPHVIGFVVVSFAAVFGDVTQSSPQRNLRADLFFSGFPVEFAGCVWTVAVSGKKKFKSLTSRVASRLQEKLFQVWRLKRWVLKSYFMHYFGKIPYKFLVNLIENLLDDSMCKYFWRSASSS